MPWGGLLMTSDGYGHSESVALGPPEESGSAEQSVTEDYYQSILNGGVTLEQVAQAKMSMGAIDEGTRHLSTKFYPRLWENYTVSQSNSYRKVIRYAIGQYAAWGIVLFSDGTLDYTYPFDFSGMMSAKWHQLVYKCSKEVDEVEMVLRGKQKRLTCAHLYAQLHTLFAAVEVAVDESSPEAVGGHLNGTLEYLEKEMEELSRNVRDLAVRTDTRVAQQQYLIGMLPGLLIVAGLIIGIHFLHFSFSPSPLITSDLELVAGSGAIGALLSVLGRTTSARLSKSLRVDTQAGAPLIVSAGAFRPIIGALLAVSIYVLIESGLLPVMIPKGSTQTLYFISAISLLAGFSERLAQDALVRTSRSVFSSGADRKADPDD